MAQFISTFCPKKKTFLNSYFNYTRVTRPVYPPNPKTRKPFEPNPNPDEFGARFLTRGLWRIWVLDPIPAQTQPLSSPNLNNIFKGIPISPSTHVELHNSTKPRHSPIKCSNMTLSHISYACNVLDATLHVCGTNFTASDAKTSYLCFGYEISVNSPLWILNIRSPQSVHPFHHHIMHIHSSPNHH